MFLVRLTYASKISDCFTPADLEKILTSSVRRNEAANITGALHFNRKFFLQTLEGSRSAVNDTYTRIVGDARHAEVTLLDYRDISQRNFADWSMKYVAESSKTTALIKTFAPVANFDPYKLSGVSASELLLALGELTPA